MITNLIATDTPQHRVRFLRTQVLKITQKKFADSIGLTRSGLAAIENGGVLTDRNIKSISDNYNVNYLWLRHGKAPIFNDLSERQKIDAFLDDIFNDENSDFEIRILSALSQLDKNEWLVIEKLLKKMVSKD